MSQSGQNTRTGRRRPGRSGCAAACWIAGAACLGLMTPAVAADDSTRVGIAAVNTYANGVKQSLRMMTMIDANNPMGTALDPNTERLRRSATESCESNWQGLTGMAISADPAVKELANLRISQLSLLAGDDPCHLP